MDASIDVGSRVLGSLVSWTAFPMGDHSVHREIFLWTLLWTSEVGFLMLLDLWKAFPMGDHSDHSDHRKNQIS